MFSLNFISIHLELSFSITVQLAKLCHFTPSVVLGQFVFRLSVQHPGELLGVPWLLKSDVHHHLSFSAWPSVWMHWPLQAVLSAWTHSAAAVAACVFGFYTHFGHLVARDVSVHASACSSLLLYCCACMAQYMECDCVCYTTHLWLCSGPICAFPLSQHLGTQDGLWGGK